MTTVSPGLAVEPGSGPTALRLLLRLPLAVAALSVPQALGLLVALPTSVVLAREYGASGKGAVTTVTASVVFAGALLNLSVGDSLGVQAARGLGPPRLRRALTLTWLCLALPALLLAVLVTGPGSTTTLVVAGTALSVLLTCSAVAALGLRGPRWWAWGQVLQPTVFLVLVLLAAASDAPVERVLAAYLVALATGAVLFWCWLPSRVPSDDDDVSGMRRVLRYGALRHLANLGHLVIARVDVLIVAALASSAEVGVYSVAYGTAELALWFSTAFAAMVFHAQMRPGAALAPRLVLMAMVMSALPAVGLALLAPLLLPVVYGPAFAASVLPLLVLLPGIVALGVVHVLSAQFTARGKAGTVARVSWSTAVPALLVTPPLVMAFGVLGAAGASALAYGLMAALMVRAHRRSFPEGT